MLKAGLVGEPIGRSWKEVAWIRPRAEALVRSRSVGVGRAALALIGSSTVLAAVVFGFRSSAVAVGALLLYGETAWFGPAQAGSSATAQAVALTLPGVVLMLVAAAGFARPVFRQRNMTKGLMGAAAILLAAGWSYSLLVPGL